MRKIVDFGEYIKEYIKFPQGGNIGGEHKKTIKDEDFDKLPTSSSITQTAYNIEREKNDERKINLMGDKLNGHHDQHFIESLINAAEKYRIDNRDNFYFGSVKQYLNAIPQGVIDHFDIDVTTDDGVIDFINNKIDLLKRSFDMWKEIKNTYPGERYGK